MSRGSSSDRRIGIEILGDKKLERYFDRLEFAVQRKIVRKTARKTAKEFIPRIVQHMRFEHRTGLTRDKIHIKPFKRSRRYIGMTIQTGTRAMMGIPWDAKHYYPAVLEYGHPAPDRSHAAPRPFMRTALAQGEGWFISRWGAYIWQEVRRLRA